MKKKYFDFEVMNGKPIGNLTISEVEEEKEWHIDCFETVFGKSDKEENQTDWSNGDSGVITLKNSLILSALSLVSLAAAIIILVV